MAAVRELCDTAIYLKNGCLVSQGNTKDIVLEYYSNAENQGANAVPKPSIELLDDVYIESVNIEDKEGNKKVQFKSSGDWCCRVTCKAEKSQSNLIVAVGLVSMDKTPIQTVWSNPINTDKKQFEVFFSQNKIDLEEGTYSVVIGLAKNGIALQQFEAARIEIQHQKLEHDNVIKKYGAGFIVNAMNVNVIV
jgi:ABC-type glutathione transport system ATPase component